MYTHIRKVSVVVFGPADLHVCVCVCMCVCVGVCEFVCVHGLACVVVCVCALMFVGCSHCIKHLS